MPRVLVCPDKFRGSMSGAVAARAIARGLQRGRCSDVQLMPLADGGEGTLDALVQGRGGSLRSATVTGPSGTQVSAQWAMLGHSTGVVEMARAAGHDLVVGPRDALHATSRGAGELIDAAIRAGCTEVIVGVGGSATTDGGLPALDALRWSLRGARVVVACDVTTTFIDAARVFGPQKGATPAQVALLTRRLETLAATYRERTGVDVTVIPGSGAAGGFAGGLAAIGASLEAGFDVVADALGFDEAMESADYVISGEGRLDASSLEGKVVGNVCDAAREYGIGAAIICGDADAGVVETLRERGVAVFALRERAWDENDSFTRAEMLCEEAALEIAKTF